MNVFTRAAWIARCSMIAAMLAACSGNGLAPSMAPTQPNTTSAASDPSGAPPLALFAHTVVASLPEFPATGPGASQSAATLYVANAGNKAIEEFHVGGSYGSAGSITGLQRPAGDWVDAAGHLYVADYKARTVDEYAPGSSSPNCTYSSGLVDPINVTTDSTGNVYVVDYDFGLSGSIDRYAQCSNTIAAQYAVGGAPEGAAVDASGNLFVSYNANGSGTLEEFQAGSKRPTPLAVTLQFAGGLLLDSHGNLLACDQIAGYVDEIPTPYNAIVLQYSGFVDPVNASIGDGGRLLFVADPVAHHVVVLTYPSGLHAKQLGRAHDVATPVGVAVSAGTTR